MKGFLLVIKPLIILLSAIFFHNFIFLSDSYALSKGLDTQCNETRLPLSDGADSSFSIALSLPLPALHIASQKDIVESQQLKTAFFQLKSNSNVYFLDFATLEEQGCTMNRLALLIEASNAPKDRITNDKEMAGLIMETRQNIATLYLGHDMKLESIALFYNLANKNNVTLNAYEHRLKTLLLKNKLLNLTNNKHTATNNKALVTASQLQKDNPDSPQDETITRKMRQFIIQHEMSHGEYFTNQKYKHYCYHFWNKILTHKQRHSIRHYLDNKYYDTTQEDLMINEFQAYLAYTGVHFIDLFDENKLEGISAAELLNLRSIFISGSTSSLPVNYSD